jgi:hypothetical protein
MKTYGEQQVQLHTLLTPVTDGDEWPGLSSVHFTPNGERVSQKEQHALNL